MDVHNKKQINDWYHAYSNDLYKFIYFMTGDAGETKDLLQDTFLRAYNKSASFDGRNAKSWLFRIARNITIDYMRRKKPVSFLFDAMPAVTASGKTPEQEMLLNETEKDLYRALRKLKRSYRDVIILRKIREFTISETANILGWPESKVKVTLFRALKALKKQLEKEGYEHETI